QSSSGAPSLLEQQILRQLDCAIWSEVKDRAETAPDEVFPRIFPVIAAAADAGDPRVREILLDAVAELSSLAMEVADRLALSETTFKLAKTGGMFGRSVFFETQFDTALNKILRHAQIGGLRISAAEAAALAARG